LYKVYQPFFKYLRPHRATLLLATLCGIIAGVSSGIGLPFIFNHVLARAFEADTGANPASSEIVLASLGGNATPASIPPAINEETALKAAVLHTGELWQIPGVVKVSVGTEIPPADHTTFLQQVRGLPGEIKAAIRKLTKPTPTGQQAVVLPNYTIHLAFADEAASQNPKIPTQLDGVPVNVLVHTGIWQVLKLALLVPLIFAMRAVFGYASGLLSTRVAVEFSRSLQQDVFDHVQAMPMSFFDTHQRGDLQTRLSRDTSYVQAAVIDTGAELLKQPFQAAAALISIVYLSWANREIGFVVALLIVAPVCMIPVRYFGRKVRRRSRQWAEHAATIAQHLWENFNGIHEIRSFSLEEAQKRGFQEKLHLFLETQYKVKKYLLMQQPTMETIVALLLSGIFVYAWARDVSFATFTAFGMAMYFAFDPIKRMGTAFNTLQQAEANATRLQEFFAITPDIKDPSSPKPLANVRGEVVFDQVTFAYGETPVLRNVSVTIPAGCNCALVGPSGAGKSTFAKLIPRFYDVGQGRVMIDGIDVRDVRQTDLRRQVAVVSQHPVLFDLSLLENIRLGRPAASDEEVMEAARRAHADRFIRGFAEGYNTLAGDRGDRLSGGQKQRIAIARAFLKNAPVLLLDEATSALDTENEQAIQAALAELTRGRTVLTIAHRMSTIRKSDLILVFDHGELVAQGTHGELMAHAPVYQALVNRQLDEPNLA
jgi:subfamily B ATP-binding cassette protein MsbA